MKHLKNYLKFGILCFGIIFSLNSCQKDNPSILQNESRNGFKAALVDGRLHFNNEAEFKTSIEYMKALKDVEVENLMYAYYEEGFEPLYPFYKSNDETRFNTFFERKSKRTPISSKTALSTNLDVDDDLINDDYFAGLLNSDREIVIAQQLYKYTYDGVFRVDIRNETDLDNYLFQSRTNKPDPRTLPKGLVQVRPTIERFIANRISIGCDSEPYIADVGPNDPGTDATAFYNGCYNVGSGGGGNSNPPADYTESMKNYMKDLEPCHLHSGGIFGWSPFGVSRRCYSSHSSKHRVKTKYWNENLLFYSSIGVKVKHQKKARIGWRAYETNEVALVINQAMFAVTHPNQIPPSTAFPIYPSNDNRLYFYDGKYYDNFNSSFLIANGWTPASNLVPLTPFQDDIIVQEYIDLPILRNLDDIEIEAKEINKLFWNNGVWEGAKTLMGRFNEKPTRVTYIVTTPQKMYVNYVDLTQRKLNNKKIVNTFDYDWGGEIKIKWAIDGNGNWSSNVGDWGNPLNYYKVFDIPHLTDFETVSMDFVGMTRRGTSWKGSRIVYQKDQ